MTPVRLGILSTAHINRLVIPGAHASDKVELVAVASRERSRAEEYARKWNIERAYGSYEALLDDPDVDAVYISLPNTLHCEWSIRAVEAGKHVLCEKPLSRHPADVEEAFDAAERAHRLLTEAFMYRHNPQTARVVELIREGATLIRDADDLLGDLGIELVQAEIAERVDLDEAERRVLEAIVEPTLPDRLASALGVGIPEIVGVLMRLELRGFVRNVGGSVGVALATTLLARRSQQHQATLAGHLNAWSVDTTMRLKEWTDHFVSQGADSFTAQRRALAMVYQEVTRQAQVLAFADDFWLLALVSLAILPLVPLMHRVRTEQNERARERPGRVEALPAPDNSPIAPERGRD